MKKLHIILLLLTGFQLASFAQKCNLAEDKKDAFTGKLIKSSKKELLFNTNDTWFESKVKRTSDEFTGVLFFYKRGELNESIPEGLEIFLKTDKNSIVKLIPQNNAIPKTEVVANGAGALVFTAYELEFKLEKEMLIDLSDGLITDIKFSFKNEFNAVVKKKQAEKLIQQ